jgi:hypothetical protein
MVIKTMFYLMLLFSSIILTALSLTLINDLVERLWQRQQPHRDPKPDLSVIVLPPYQPVTADTAALEPVIVRTYRDESELPKAA